MNNSKPYVLWGAAGHAKVLTDLIQLKGGQVIALFDNRQVDSPISDMKVWLGLSGFRSWLSKQSDISHISGLAAIGGGNGRDRLKVHQLFLESGLQVPQLVHPRACVSKFTRLGSGVQILAMANVAAGVVIGDAVIVNHMACVDHECTLGDGTHIAPAATLCGCVTVGKNVFVGAGATVKPRVILGDGCVIGAGAVVIGDVPSGTVMVGNPARPYLNRLKKASDV